MRLNIEAAAGAEASRGPSYFKGGRPRLADQPQDAFKYDGYECLRGDSQIVYLYTEFTGLSAKIATSASTTSSFEPPSGA
jgi:hypothetical protein